MKIIISGIGGRMGSEVLKLCQSNYRDSVAVCGVDFMGAGEDLGIPVYSSFSEIKEKADCVIDFSNHAMTQALTEFCISTNTPAIIATTGQTAEERDMILNAAKTVPMFFSANMSLGVALLCELAAIAAKTMADADIEIVEAHHNRKLDAPSGTALMLVDAVKSVRDGMHTVEGRSGQHKREKNEIGVHSLRLGNVVGEHEVIIGTDTQTITLKHEAHTRALFAEGAVVAAEFVVKQQPGLYAMKDMIKL